MAGSTYFSALLSGNYNDAETSEEICVDRDPEPFQIILSFLRSGGPGRFVYPENKKELLGAVFLEADFYRVDSLLVEIKAKCYRNLRPPEHEPENKDVDEARKLDDAQAAKRLNMNTPYWNLSLKVPFPPKCFLQRWLSTRFCRRRQYQVPTIFSFRGETL